MVYIYREDPKVSNYGGLAVIDKGPGYIGLRLGVQVSFANGEEVQFAIREKHGGKASRLILKCSSERISDGKCISEAPPEFAPPEPAFPRGGTSSKLRSAFLAVCLKGFPLVRHANRRTVLKEMKVSRGGHYTLTTTS